MAKWRTLCEPMPRRFRRPQTAPEPQTARTPTPLAQLLDDAQTETARRAGAAFTPTVWRGAVGARIADRTRVGSLVRGTLTIYAASSTWANELTFLTADIIARLRAAGVDVHTLKFRIKDLGAPPNPKTARASAPRAPAKAPLPPDLVRRLAQVEDPELRAAIAEAAALSLGANRASRK
jgi:predicted nucleic acid-binding Zn ribbon protein